MSDSEESDTRSAPVALEYESDEDSLIDDWQLGTEVADVPNCDLPLHAPCFNVLAMNPTGALVAFICGVKISSSGYDVYKKTMENSVVQGLRSATECEALLGGLRQSLHDFQTVVAHPLMKLYFKEYQYAFIKDITEGMSGTNMRCDPFALFLKLVTEASSMIIECMKKVKSLSKSTTGEIKKWFLAVGSFPLFVELLSTVGVPVARGVQSTKLEELRTLLSEFTALYSEQRKYRNDPLHKKKIDEEWAASDDNREDHDKTDYPLFNHIGLLLCLAMEVFVALHPLDPKDKFKATPVERKIAHKWELMCGKFFKSKLGLKEFQGLSRLNVMTNFPYVGQLPTIKTPENGFYYDTRLKIAPPCLATLAGDFISQMRNKVNFEMEIDEPDTEKEYYIVFLHICDQAKGFIRKLKDKTKEKQKYKAHYVREYHTKHAEDASNARGSKAYTTKVSGVSIFQHDLFLLGDFRHNN